MTTKETREMAIRILETTGRPVPEKLPVAEARAIIEQYGNSKCEHCGNDLDQNGECPICTEMGEANSNHDSVVEEKELKLTDMQLVLMNQIDIVLSENDNAMVGVALLKEQLDEQMTKFQLGGVLSTLVEKGLVEIHKVRGIKSKFVVFTEKGIDWIHSVK